MTAPTDLPKAHLDALEKIRRGVPTRDILSAFNHAVSGQRKFPIPSKEARHKLYLDGLEAKKLFEKNKQPFLSPNFGNDFWLSQGLTVVGATTGKSKSTTAANVLAGILKYRDDTKVLVISGEETADNILNRVSCIMLGLPFMDYYHGRLGSDSRHVEEYALTLTDRIIIANSPGWDMRTLEDVQSAILTCDGTEIHAVVMDYLQTIVQSSNEPDMEYWAILKKMGWFFKDYGISSPVPIIMFAQINTEGPCFPDRVQGDKTFANHGVNLIEIKPDFDKLVTKFIIHKQRFGGGTNREITMQFNHGRYQLEGERDF